VKIFDCIEKAHFWYKDNQLGGKKLRWSDFFRKVLNECPDVFVHEKVNRFQLFERYKKHLNELPRYGTVITNRERTRVLLLRAANMPHAGYGFPKGKRDAEETPAEAALRETLEVRVPAHVLHCTRGRSRRSPQAAGEGGGRLPLVRHRRGRVWRALHRGR